MGNEDNFKAEDEVTFWIPDSWRGKESNTNTAQDYTNSVIYVHFPAKNQEIRNRLALPIRSPFSTGSTCKET